MKLCSMLAIWLSAVSALAADRSLLDVKKIYLLSMSSGLEQHIATRLAQDGRYTVVTDAALADAILTDRIGESFEQQMEELYPPPPSATAEAKDSEKKRADEPRLGDLLSQHSPNAMRTTSFSRSKGNVYLVDRQSKQVLWSTWLRPSGREARELHRAAGQIADRLQDSAKDMQKRMARAVPPPAPVPAPAPVPVRAPAVPAAPPASPPASNPAAAPAK